MVLPPNKCNDTISQPLPVWSDSFMQTTVTVLTQCSKHSYKVTKTVANLPHKYVNKNTQRVQTSAITKISIKSDPGFQCGLPD